MVARMPRLLCVESGAIGAGEGKADFSRAVRYDSSGRCKRRSLVVGSHAVPLYKEGAAREWPVV